MTRDRARVATRLLRVGAVALGLAFAAAPGGAGAQHGGFTPNDVPAGPATVRGRVVHAGRPEAAGGVEVVLYALPGSGVPGLRRTTTDASGAFVFERISNSPDVAYLVGARYSDVPFPGDRIVFAAGETEKTSEIKIADPTVDPAGVSVLESQVRLDRSAQGANVVETHRLRNTGSHVVWVPAGDRARARPAVSIALPAGAQNLQHPLGMRPEGLVDVKGGLAFYGPIYPGEQELTLSYDLPLAAGPTTIKKRFPTAAERVRVLTTDALGPVRARGLAPAPDVTENERVFRAREATRVAAGTVLELGLDPPATRTDPAALEVTDVRLVLDMDDAAVTVQEEHHVRVSPGAPLLGSAAHPLLWIPLPEGADDLRFSTASAGLGLAPDARGGLAVQGPLPPGETAIQVQYRVPVKDGSVDLGRPFGQSFPLLSVYVADSGIETSSERLHRRRPVRTEDRAYLHLEAFEIEAGEPVPLRLAALRPGGGVSGAAEAVVVALLAAIAVLLLVRPVVGAADTAEDAIAAPAERKERDSLYTALRDLEDDFETGKIAEADYRTMRDELRGRAVALLQAERDAARAAARAAPAAPAAPASCPSCGGTPRPEDRFCGRCGTRIAAESPGREASA